MNEKELREAWTNWIDDVVQEGWNPNRYPHLVPNIADWFIARIKERDERLKEKVLKFQWTHNRAGKTSMYVDDIINLIDNHD